MSAAKCSFHTPIKDIPYKLSNKETFKMSEAKSNKYNVAFYVLTGLIVVVFSLVFSLAMIQYRSEMESLQRTILTLRSDILVQMAKDKKYFDSKSNHRVFRREASDQLLGKTFALLGRNFTELDDFLSTPLQALKNVSFEITSIRDEVKEMKSNFSVNVARLDELAKQAAKCAQSQSSLIYGEEIVKLVLKLTDTVSSLKRVVVLSTLKSTTIRNNVALFHRFECALKEGLSQVENRITSLEGSWLNATNHSTDFSDSLDDLRADLRQINSDIKLNNDKMARSVNAKLDVMGEQCNDTDFLRSVHDKLETQMNGMRGATKIVNSRLRAMLEKSKVLTEKVDTASSMLDSLKEGQNSVGDTCANNRQQAIEILDKLDMFNETESDTNYTIIEYCAERHGCVKVKEYKKHCYKIYDTTSASWYDAADACHAEGGYLVEINSDTEYQKLTNFITRTRYYWVGGTDLDSENSWYWGYSKGRVWLNAWRGNNPSNDGGIEHCMHLYANRISWNDANCYTRYSFICERDFNCEGWD